VIEFEITELNRRLANLILLGRVVETDYQSVIPKLKIKIGDLTTAWLPMLTARAGPDASWWPLEIGEQVLVLSPSGELSQGVVLGALNQRIHPAVGSAVNVHRQVYADGAIIEYDRTSHHLSATLPAGGTTTLVSHGGIQLVGDVNVFGTLSVTEDIIDHTRSMQEDRDIYNVHTHGGVSSGTRSTTPTDQPQ